MHPPLTPKIVIATHNEGKLREFATLLAPYVPEIVSAGQLGLPSPEETGTTFAENALLKAKAAALASGNLALGDDSGLCVNALGGDPGIYSARWTLNGTAAAFERLQKGLAKTHDRSAYFICVLTLCWPDGFSESVEGRVYGSIAESPRGENGHGYDPIFIPDGYALTFAEMDSGAKNLLSHRGVATKTLIERFFAQTKG